MVSQLSPVRNRQIASSKMYLKIVIHTDSTRSQKWKVNEVLNSEISDIIPGNVLKLYIFSLWYW